jgi:hypothetical protein
MWNGRVLELIYPELFSFTVNTKITVQSVRQLESFHDLFQLPMSLKAFEQYCELDIFMQSLHPTNTKDTWSYIWGSKNYSSLKAYRHLIDYDSVHTTLKWIWKTKCQTKHKVFLWLLLQDRLNTKGMLRRKNMYLDSYVCEMCIWLRVESLWHLFFRCSFAKNC